MLDMKELIKLFNNHSVVGNIDDYIEENAEVEELKGYTFNFVENIDMEEHRWYFIDTNVYQVLKDGNAIGYVGVVECGSLKSESMGREDTYIATQFFEVKEVTKRTFELVEGEEQ